MNTELGLADEGEWMKVEGVYLVDGASREKPCAVVWTGLPMVTWLCPLIGHVGITDSRGLVTDFSGCYIVTVGSLMGGPARRIWRLDVDDMDLFDSAVHEGAAHYGSRVHKYANFDISACPFCMTWRAGSGIARRHRR
jgi:hypothetical protein